MTIERARIIKGAFPAPTPTDAASGRAGQDAVRPREVGRAAAVAAERARRIAREVMEARAEAERIVAEARARADAIVAEAAEKAAAEAREREVARLAAGFLELREAEARRMERDLDRLVELAVILAERLVGEAIRVEPARVAELAAAAIQEARGARRVRIDACPEDVAALEETLGAIGQIADIHADPTLGRGSLVVHTDLGRVDARLQPQLARLAVALREALR